MLTGSQVKTLTALYNHLDSKMNENYNDHLFSNKELKTQEQHLDIISNILIRHSYVTSRVAIFKLQAMQIDVIEAKEDTADTTKRRWLEAKEIKIDKTISKLKK